MNNSTIFKPHPVYKIQIGNDGTVIGVRGKPLRPYKTNCGYLCVCICRGGKRGGVSVHRLVAHTFLEPSEKPHVNHIDGNKENNSASNLEWVTASENAIHALKNDLYKPKKIGETQRANATQRGINNGRAIVNETIVREIRALPSGGKPWISYGISQSTYQAIRSGRNWSHVK